jgi:hypothetical protein
MMDDFIVSAELRVFVLQGVVTVRAVNDDLLELVIRHHLHVSRHQGLRKILVAHPARGITTMDSLTPSAS